MGRKSKCTVEEKISAVEDYLNGKRTVSEIMMDLSIRSKRSVRDWILAYQQRGVEALYPITKNNCYTKEFKNEMVQRYLNGEAYGAKGINATKRSEVEAAIKEALDCN